MTFYESNPQVRPVGQGPAEYIEHPAPSVARELPADRGRARDGHLHDVGELLSASGPFVSVALPTPSALDDASHRIEIRWRNARRELEGTGVDDNELARLEGSLVGLDHSDGAAVVLLQAPGIPTFVELLDSEIRDELVVVDSLPRLGPVLESRQRSVPHLMVVVDRAGADIVGIGADSTPVEVEVDGEPFHLHRGHPGGWSQRRFQQRAENLWESNACANAAQVAELARRLDARLITIAGDVRAVGFLRDHLPADVADMALELDGQSPDAVADQTVRAVADVVARETRAVLEEFRAADGQGHAASGVGATLEALSAGRVRMLLVHDDPNDLRRGAFDPSGIGVTAQRAPNGFRDGRLVDVAMRSALLGGAGIRFVPQHAPPDESLGALLRW